MSITETDRQTLVDRSYAKTREYFRCRSGSPSLTGTASWDRPLQRRLHQCAASTH